MIIRRTKRQAHESIWIKLRVNHNFLKFIDLHGEDVIAITKSQIDRLMKVYEAKKGTIIKLSRTQLAYNMKIEWGFLPMLAGLIPFLMGTVLPALGVGGLSKNKI